MRIAHISDTHLGYRQYNLDERENDIYNAFNEVVDRILEERVDIVIHSGDLFDSYRPPIKALKVFKEALGKLKGRVRKILAVLGDHDIPKRRGLPPHSLFDEVKVLGIGKLEWMEIDGVLVAGISNLRGRGIELLKSELSKFDRLAEKYRKSVLIAHQGVKRYFPFEYELEEDDLPRKATYYAFGHIHSRTLVRFGGGFFAYAGSIEIMRRDEIESWMKKGKGFYIVDLERDEPEIHTINVDVRPQYRVEVDLSKTTLEKALAKYVIQTYSRLPVLHITVSGKSIVAQTVLRRLSSILKNKVLKYTVTFREAASLDQAGSSETFETQNIGLKELLREYLEKHGIKDEKYVSLALELHKNLSEGDVEGAKKVVEEFLEGGEE